MLSRLAHGVHVDSPTKSRKRRCRTGVPNRTEGVVLQVRQRPLRGVRRRRGRHSTVAVGEGAARGRLAAGAALDAVVCWRPHCGVALDAGLACRRVGAALGDGLALLLQPAPAVCWLRAADVELRPQSCGRKEQARVSKDSATNLRAARIRAARESSSLTETVERAVLMEGPQHTLRAIGRQRILGDIPPGPQPTIIPGPRRRLAATIPAAAR